MSLFNTIGDRVHALWEKYDAMRREMKWLTAGETVMARRAAAVIAHACMAIERDQVKKLIRHTIGAFQQPDDYEGIAAVVLVANGLDPEIADRRVSQSMFAVVEIAYRSIDSEIADRSVEHLVGFAKGKFTAFDFFAALDNWGYYIGAQPAGPVRSLAEELASLNEELERMKLA